MRVLWRTPAVGLLKKILGFHNITPKVAGMCSCDTENSITTNGRVLHFVLKIPDRKEMIRFFKDILGMKVLRHEEFAEGCEATCNGPYGNRWSKTMVGYGPEDNNFVFELTYNYPIKHYENGNDFIGITLISQDVLRNAKEQMWPINDNIVEAPGGYKFFIMDAPPPKNVIEKVTLACSNLDNTINYWNAVLGLKVYAKEMEPRKKVLLGFKEDQTKIEFVELDQPIDRGQAFGRIAFSCSDEELSKIEPKIKKAKGKILVPLTSLDTAGKATVRVVILADPDGHEICFVNDDAFRELSQYSPEDEQILEVQIRKEQRLAKKAQKDSIKQKEAENAKPLKEIVHDEIIPLQDEDSKRPAPEAAPLDTASTNTDKGKNVGSEPAQAGAIPPQSAEGLTTAGASTDPKQEGTPDIQVIATGSDQSYPSDVTVIEVHKEQPASQAADVISSDPKTVPEAK